VNSPLPAVNSAKAAIASSSLSAFLSLAFGFFNSYSI
jgi:hypothetical protein